MTIDATSSASAPNALGTAQLFGLVSQIGYLIALPAALLGFGGAYLDKTLSTSPLFILLGFALALLTSSFTIWRKIKPLLHA